MPRPRRQPQPDNRARAGKNGFPVRRTRSHAAAGDTVLITCGLGPETRGLIDARRLALFKPGALLINVARAARVDEGALHDARKDGDLGGAALDVWWQCPTAAEPERRPSRRPFHELPNVLITPHSSAQAKRQPTGVGVWWPPISIASRGASHSKALCFRADSLI